MVKIKKSLFALFSDLTRKKGQQLFPLYPPTITFKISLNNNNNKINAFPECGKLKLLRHQTCYLLQKVSLMLTLIMPVGLHAVWKINEAENREMIESEEKI